MPLWIVRALALTLSLLAAGGRAAPLALTPFSTATGAAPPAPWRVAGLPNSRKPLTRFEVVRLDGQTVLKIQADRSYANLVHDVQPPQVLSPGAHLDWRWRLDKPLLLADLRRRDGDDMPLRLCVSFDVPLENLGFVDRSFLQVARATAGEHLPAATLCYVWDHTLPVGTLLRNAFTSRIRMIVVDNGEEHLGQWVSHNRDVVADFRRAFGTEARVMPPLEAVLVGADADNTDGHSLGYVGDITVTP
jgi:hypothetical protein